MLYRSAGTSDLENTMRRHLLQREAVHLCEKHKLITGKD
jgi:hypothetical protein